MVSWMDSLGAILIAPTPFKNKTRLATTDNASSAVKNTSKPQIEGTTVQRSISRGIIKTHMHTHRKKKKDDFLAILPNPHPNPFAFSTSNKTGERDCMLECL